MALASSLKARTATQTITRKAVAPTKLNRKLVLVNSAPADSDAELERRLEALKIKSKPKKEEKPAPIVSSKEKKAYDYTGESVHYEGPPHRGDLALNLALGTTLIWIPLTLAAVGRAAFMNYRFTDRRLSVVTNAPWQVEQIDVAYQEVKEVISVGRALGLWGDLIVTLKDGSKVELRSLDKFLDLKKYILERRDALGGGEIDPVKALMEDEEKPKKKGFAK